MTIDDDVPAGDVPAGDVPVGGGRNPFLCTVCGNHYLYSHHGDCIECDTLCEIYNSDD